MNHTTIDLNCDLGESFGVYRLGLDQEIIPAITSANIACGWHAGDPLVMNRTVRLAAGHGVSCGAHPGYPDLLGFGRRAMEVGRDELKCYLIYQIGALDGFCRAHGVALRHVKPHGSLYHAALESEATALAVAEAVAAVDRELILVTLAGQKGTVMAEAAAGLGLAVAREAFADRAYTAEGTLVPRHLPGAVISDAGEVARRAVQIVTEGAIEAAGGERIELAAQTLCLHGDNPQAVAVARAIRRELAGRNITVRPMRR